MNPNQSQILAELKALKPSVTPFHFADLFGIERGQLKSQASMRVLNTWQQLQAFSEAHSYTIKEWLNGDKDSELKHDTLSTEHIKFAHMLKWAVVDGKGLPVFGSARDVLEICGPARLESLFGFYCACVRKDRNVPGSAEEFSPDFVLTVCEGIADLDAAIVKQREEAAASGSEAMPAAITNALLARFEKPQLEELLIRLSIIAKGCGIFPSQESTTDAPQG